VKFGLFSELKGSEPPPPESADGVVLLSRGFDVEGLDIEGFENEVGEIDGFVGFLAILGFGMGTKPEFLLDFKNSSWNLVLARQVSSRRTSASSFSISDFEFIFVAY
jgi:hypothetical protein